MKGLSRQVRCSLSKRVELVSRYADRLSNFDSAHLDNVIIVVIVESEIDHLLRMADDLPDGWGAIVVGIRHFCLLREIGCVTRRETLGLQRGGLKIGGYSSSLACLL